MIDVHQRPDHLKLLGRPAAVEVTQTRPHAIVVPSARTAPYLREAAWLAQELNTVLMVLCSKRADGAAIHRYVEGHGIVADVVTIDLPARRPRALPSLETSALLNGTKLQRATDVSRKRNLALILARMVGWDRLVFLDDDIRVPDPLDLRRATGQLDVYDAVGLRITGCADNSVVCHAIRATGGEQGTFVGGGALAVAADRVDGFFPDVYNEDWFYLLGDGGAFRPVTRLGEAVQYPYDPYADPDRARREEFGDDLAEGLFAVLGDGGRIADADHRYWKHFLAARHRLVVDLHARALASPLPNRHEVAAAMVAALGRLAIITPEMCVAYLDAWQRDRKVWVDVLGAAPWQSLGDALRSLNMHGRSTVRLSRSEPMPREPRFRRARPVADHPAGVRRKARPVLTGAAALRAVVAGPVGARTGATAAVAAAFIARATAPSPKSAPAVAGGADIGPVMNPTH
jgi:hypothetical protein